MKKKDITENNNCLNDIDKIPETNPIPAVSSAPLTWKDPLPDESGKNPEMDFKSTISPYLTRREQNILLSDISKIPETDSIPTVSSDPFIWKYDPLPTESGKNPKMDFEPTISPYLTRREQNILLSDIGKIPEMNSTPVISSAPLTWKDPLPDESGKNPEMDFKSTISPYLTRREQNILLSDISKIPETDSIPTVSSDPFIWKYDPLPTESGKNPKMDFEPTISPYLARREQNILLSDIGKIPEMNSTPVISSAPLTWKDPLPDESGKNPEMDFKSTISPYLARKEQNSFLNEIGKIPQFDDIKSYISPHLQSLEGTTLLKEQQFDCSQKILLLLDRIEILENDMQLLKNDLKLQKRHLQQKPPITAIDKHLLIHLIKIMLFSSGLRNCSDIDIEVILLNLSFPLCELVKNLTQPYIFPFIYLLGNLIKIF